MASSFALSPVQYGPTPGASKHCQPPRNRRISIIVAPGCMGLADSGIMPPMKYWELVADKLSAAGWSWTRKSLNHFHWLQGGRWLSGAKMSNFAVSIESTLCAVAWLQRIVN